MLPESLNNRKLWDFLLRVDAFEADRVREEGCRHCGGILHSGGFVRKPRGIDYLIGAKHAELSFRQSFCCGSCRRRSLPQRCACWVVGCMWVWWLFCCRRCWETGVRRRRCRPVAGFM